MGTIPGEANMEEELYGGIWSGKKPTVAIIHVFLS